MINYFRNRVRNRVRNALDRLHQILLIFLATTTTTSLALFRLFFAQLRQLRHLLHRPVPRGRALLPEKLRRRLLGQRVVPWKHHLLSNRPLAVPPILIGFSRNRLLVT